MDKPGNPAKFSPEMRERAVRMVFEGLSPKEFRQLQQLGISFRVDGDPL